MFTHFSDYVHVHVPTCRLEDSHIIDLILEYNIDVATEHFYLSALHTFKYKAKNKTRSQLPE